LLSAADTTSLAASTSTAIAQAPFSGAISSHSQRAHPRTELSSASLVEDGPASQSMFSGAHDFGMRDLVHAPNATHVNIANEESNPYDSVDIGA
jgi:hypothetical protein